MMKKMAFESKYVTAGEDFPQRRRRLRCFQCKSFVPTKIETFFDPSREKKGSGRNGIYLIFAFKLRQFFRVEF